MSTYRWSSEHQQLVRQGIPDRDFKIKLGCKKHIACRSCILSNTVHCERPNVLHLPEKEVK